MPFLSIVIPVYNVEAYLPQCVNSVLQQELQDYEIILVDDGSLDNSPQLCDSYAELHSEIQVIHQINGGLSAARNTGLLAAKGEYLIFLDSDDWWNPDVCVQKMLDSVRCHPDVEMFLFSGLDFIEGTGLYQRNDSKNLDRIDTTSAENYYASLLQTGNLQVHAGTKIYRRDFLEKNNLHFENGLTGEDNLWIIHILRVLQRPGIIAEPLYVYRINRKGSISNTIGKKNILDLLEIVDRSIEYYKGNEPTSRIMQYELCFCAYLWYCALGLTWRLTKNEKAELYPLFRKTTGICLYSTSPKTKTAGFFCRIFGIRITAVLFGVYLRLKDKFQLNKSRIRDENDHHLHTSL